MEPRCPRQFCSYVVQCSISQLAVHWHKGCCQSTVQYWLRHNGLVAAYKLPNSLCYKGVLWTQEYSCEIFGTTPCHTAWVTLWNEILVLQTFLNQLTNLRHSIPSMPSGCDFTTVAHRWIIAQVFSHLSFQFASLTLTFIEFYWPFQECHQLFFPSSLSF